MRSTHRRAIAALCGISLAFSGVLYAEAAEELPAIESLDALSPLEDLVESEQHPEVNRSTPIPWEGTEEVGEDTDEVRLFAVPAEEPELGENLVPNPDLEETTASGLPVSWKKGGYGNNTRTLTYPVGGVGGGKAIEVRITSYVSGDAKWFSDDISVNPGEVYEISDFMKSTVPSFITLQFKKTDGSFIYTDVLQTGSHADFTKVEAMFTVPGGVESLNIFHLIKEPGVLTTDNYSLRKVSSGGGGDGNLMPNPGFEIDGGSGLPVSWKKGGYGNNTRTLTYPVSGDGGGKAARVQVSNFVSGDAKWYHNPLSLDPGIYTFSDRYQSTVPSIITVEFKKGDGTLSYLDIATLPASPGSFSNATADFTVPSGVVAVTVFHLIKSNGSLTIDGTGLFEKAGPESVLDDGAVSLAFDDGWDAHHSIVLPKLNSKNMEATFYIVSERFDEDGFPAFMTVNQVREIRNSGHEIGSHTKTHRDLTTLSLSEQREEIEDSKEDLESLGLGPITTFAYPFGAYNPGILTIVKDTPYTAARATINGNVTVSSDRYQLERLSIESDTTLAEVKEAIDNALENNEWIILTFHRIDESGLRYSTTPQTFNAIVDYIASTGAFVPTIAEGIESL